MQDLLNQVVELIKAAEAKNQELSKKIAEAENKVAEAKEKEASLAQYAAELKVREEKVIPSEKIAEMQAQASAKLDEARKLGEENKAIRASNDQAYSNQLAIIETEREALGKEKINIKASREKLEKDTKALAIEKEQYKSKILQDLQKKLG
jgi:hypothetical protein